MNNTTSGSEGVMFNVSLNSDSASEGENNPVSGSSEISSSFVSLTSQGDENPDEAAEKARLIGQVLELQNTLEDLSQRVDSVKEENLKLKSENEVLGKYIDNLMTSSSVFQQTGTKPKGKSK
uniref:Short coiled-coil protein B-like n=1 Tax=Phallusia mammillata TaxID=59560 RepID=A0A6F9DSA6_9ASCI|nr:short coiled-coil protein B-like [Phallusia mammillata]